MSHLLAGSLGHVIGIDAVPIDSIGSGIDVPQAFFDNADTAPDRGRDHGQSSSALKIIDERVNEDSARDGIVDNSTETEAPAPQLSGAIAGSLVPLVHADVKTRQSV